MEQKLYLNHRIIGVSVRHEEGSLDGTSVGIGSVPIEDLFKNIVITNVHGIVESQSNHLRHINYSERKAQITKLQTFHLRIVKQTIIELKQYITEKN